MGDTMEEKIQELYYKYLKEKLDLIFDLECSGQTFTLEEERFEKKKEEDNFKVVQEDCGPHGDHTIWHLFSDGKEIDYSMISFSFLGEGFYKDYDTIKHKDGGVEIKVPNYYHISKFHDGVAIVSYGSSYERATYQVISAKGYLCNGEKFKYARTIGHGYTLVQNEKGFNVIDINGNYVFKKWSKNFKEASYGFYESSFDSITDNRHGPTPNNFSISNSFITLDDQTHPLRTELLDYKVKKVIIGNKYICNNGYSQFAVNFIPVRIYGFRYCLGYLKDKVYLYDRALNKYMELGTTRSIEYSDKDDFIINRYDNKVFMIYEEQLIDVSTYYNEKLKNKKFSINKGVKGILTYDQFTFKSMDEIDELIKKEREENEKIRKEIEEKKKIERLEEEKRKHLQDEKELEALESKAIRQLQESIEILQKIYEKRPNTKRIELDNIFINCSDHLEIRPELIPILKFIDLSLVSFNNVKMSNIDFRGTNISFDPQEAYQKDLSHSNFEGIHIMPFFSFTGVNIIGCHFSEDNDPTTIDYLNPTFASAIYDETTLYNGIPLTELLNKDNKKIVPQK